MMAWGRENARESRRFRGFLARVFRKSGHRFCDQNTRKLLIESIFRLLPETALIAKP
jgi:hypothetical protein